MAKVSVRVEPVSRAAMNGRGNHNSRGYSADWIDPRRTPFNFNLLGGDDATASIQEDIEGCDQARAGSADSEIVCAEMLSHFPAKELLGYAVTDPDTALKCLAEPAFQKWVDVTLEVMKRHGAFQVDLHMDEGAPHMQAFCSIKTERQGAKRDRSGKSRYVLNYAAKWKIQGSKKLKDFYFAAGKVSYDPEKLAKVEKRFDMKYHPEDTPFGKLQTEFAEAYQKAGLPFERGESVLKTKARHQDFRDKAAEDEIAAYQAKLDKEVADYKAEAKELAEADKSAAIEDAIRAVEDAAKAEAEELRPAAVDEAIDAMKKAVKVEVEAQRPTLVNEALDAIRTSAKAEAEKTRPAAVAAAKKAVMDEARQAAADVKTAAAEDVAAVKAHFSALKEMAAGLLKLKSEASGIVAYLQELREAADQKFRMSIWRGAQDFRAAVAREHDRAAAAAAKDAGGYKAAAERLGVR